MRKEPALTVIRFGVVCVVALTVVLLASAIDTSSRGASAMSNVRASGDVRALPQRADIVLSPLPLGDLPRTRGGSPVTTPMQAVRAAEAEFDLTDAQIDRQVGVVRARVTIRGDKLHTDVKAWVVTADADTHGLSPWTSSLVYHKLCIAISATTGRYAFAYQADRG